MKRFFEILPGALAWLTIILMFVLSWQIPTAVAIFIILFDIYWLLKTIYLSLHLRATFRAMRKNLKIDWLKRLRDTNNPNWRDIIHLVIFPMSTEPYALVRESFTSLANTHYPKEKLFVVLGIEESAGTQARETAQKIQQEFGGQFFKFLITTHPSNIAGELPGKGSNETWAAREALKHLDSTWHDETLVSVFDVDTQIYLDYFARLTYSFLETPDRLRAIYQPVPLFTNNIYHAPALARVVAFSCTFWQMMQQARPERLTTFSSQSIPLRVLLDVGFWQTDVVSEDSRIFWQAYLHYHGDFRVVPLEYPLSMDANSAPTFWGTMQNLYKQQRRWGWGVENIPYMLEGFRHDPSISRKKKWYWTFNALEGFHSWATNSLMIFALGWLPILIGGQAFTYSLLSYSLPQVTRFVIDLSMIGVATSAILGILLLPPRPQWFRIRHYTLYVLEWLLIPISLIIFGAIPGLEAQTRLMLGKKFRLGFWVTPKGRITNKEL